ncbi:MAG: rhodanese-related sulfurtransferase [Candidatus Dojkabacteria bacterium]
MSRKWHFSWYNYHYQKLKTNMETVLLYYKYVEIENPESLREAQFELCSRLSLKGRILIAKEGINGTIGGTEESCQEYIRVTSEYPGLDGMDWKISRNTEDSFPKLRVVVREEVVSFKAPVNLKNRAPYIKPLELKELLDKDEEVVILDARNDYESKIGKFKNAIAPDIKNFREFPEFVKTIEHLKDKPIVTYCTGGIRCEKASAYLIEQGFKNVKQLHGGIAKYGEEAGGKDFQGTMYVFDKRIHIPVNSENPEIISECYHCGVKVARYINCCNAECNKQIIVCEECDLKFEGGCSEECKEKSRFKKNEEIRNEKNLK